MGKLDERGNIENDIKEKFSKERIGETAKRVTPLRSDWDVLDILKALDVAYIRDQPDIARYRQLLLREQRIPQLHLDILTDAFRRSLATEKPLEFKFNSRASQEAVMVSASNDLIKVELSRVN